MSSFAELTCCPGGSIVSVWPRVLSFDCPHAAVELHLPVVGHGDPARTSREPHHHLYCAIASCMSMHSMFDQPELTKLCLAGVCRAQDCCSSSTRLLTRQASRCIHRQHTTASNKQRSATLFKHANRQHKQCSQKQTKSGYSATSMTAPGNFSTPSMFACMRRCQDAYHNTCLGTHRVIALPCRRMCCITPRKKM